MIALQALSMTLNFSAVFLQFSCLSSLYFPTIVSDLIKNLDHQDYLSTNIV